MTTEDTRRDADATALRCLEIISAAHSAHGWLLDPEPDGNKLTPDARRLLHDLGWQGEDHEDFAEQIQSRMNDQPLSLEVGGWWNLGEQPEEHEFRILLCTGGPAVRITGDLYNNYSPSNCALESQGWFIPWEALELTAEQEDALQWFCEQFCWEVG